MAGEALHPIFFFFLGVWTLETGEGSHGSQALGPPNNPPLRSHTFIHYVIHSLQGEGRGGAGHGRQTILTT